MRIRVVGSSRIHQSPAYLYLVLLALSWSVTNSMIIHPDLSVRPINSCWFLYLPCDSQKRWDLHDNSQVTLTLTGSSLPAQSQEGVSPKEVAGDTRGELRAVFSGHCGGVLLRLWSLMWLDFWRPHKESAPDWGPVGERHAHSQDDHRFRLESGQQPSAAVHSPAGLRADERWVPVSSQS